MRKTEMRKTDLMLILAMGLAGVMTSPAMAQKTAKPPKPVPPTAAEEWPAIEGTWHVLLAHEGDANLSERPEYKNSTVTIGDKRFAWTAADGKPLLAAASEWKQLRSPMWEVDLTPEGGDTLPGIAVVFDKDILKISWRGKNLDKGRPGTYLGNREHMFLLLTRQPLGAAPAGEVKLVGEWQMLTSLDDSLEKLGKGPTAARVIFTDDSFTWNNLPDGRGTFYAGGYTLDHAARPTRIKFHVTLPPPGSGATPTPPDGFVPGIVEFLDEDTVRLCYRESGWKNSDPPESRQYPEGYYSDGNINLWVFRRLRK